jgi:hypothetical protein
MTRNRHRKGTIRARQDSTGEGYAQAARHTETTRAPIQELLGEAARDLQAADATDTGMVLRAVWQGLRTVGAAGELLAACATTGDYRSRWLVASPLLAGAVRTLRATPTLRGSDTAASPAGGPGDQLDSPAAEHISQLLAQTARALAATLEQAAPHARATAARRACRAAAAAATQVAAIYEAAPVTRPSLDAAAAHPDWLPAHTAAELRRVIEDHHGHVEEADPGDTPAALTAAWYGFAVAIALGQFLALRDAGEAISHHNAGPVITQIIETLEAAPSLPADVHGTGLDTTPEADQHMLAIARRGIGDLTLALNALLPDVAEQASHPADQLAAAAGTMLAAEFFDCYAGRLRTYLNPYGRRPGQKSSIVIGGRRAAGPDRRQPPASR